jgi:hypothetical protein
MIKMTANGGSLPGPGSATTAQNLKWWHNIKKLNVFFGFMNPSATNKVWGENTFEGVRRWKDNFVTKGYIYQGKSSSQPPVNKWWFTSEQGSFKV